MKYLCKTCKKKCNDIPEHMMKVHNFSKSIVDAQIKAKADCYKNAFEVLEE